MCSQHMQTANNANLTKLSVLHQAVNLIVQLEDEVRRAIARLAA